MRKLHVKYLGLFKCSVKVSCYVCLIGIFLTLSTYAGIAQLPGSGLDGEGCFDKCYLTSFQNASPRFVLEVESLSSHMPDTAGHRGSWSR